MTSETSSTDLSVEPEALTAEGERLKTIAGDFGIVADYAQDADPDWHMWGVPGVPLAEVYFSSAEAIHTILKEFGPATAGLGQRFSDCAKRYTEADEANSSGFDELEGEMADV